MLLGIDLGTGSAKALLLATDGTAIGEETSCKSRGWGTMRTKIMRSLSVTHKTCLFLSQRVLAGLRQISSPNKAQSGFVSNEYVPIVVQPLHKTERHRCPKRL